METKISSSLTLIEEKDLRESLKRCSQETVDAAIAYRKYGEYEPVPTIVMGIIERYLEPEVRDKIKDCTEETRLYEDFGIDSLTMVESVMLVEETLNISIPNEDLRELRTVGDVKTFIDCKIRGIPVPQKPRRIPVEEVAAAMPHQDPFLFLREVTLSENEAEASYRISGSEFFLEGHFKDDPVFPGSLMLEALGQLAVFYLVKSDHAGLEGNVDHKKVLANSCDGIRFHRICRPNDTLDMKIKVKRIRAPLATFEGSISCNGDRVAIAEEITLAFAFEE